MVIIIASIRPLLHVRANTQELEFEKNGNLVRLYRRTRKASGEGRLEPWLRSHWVYPKVDRMFVVRKVILCRL